MWDAQLRVWEVAEPKVKVSFVQISSSLLEGVELMYKQYVHINLCQLQYQSLVYLSDF